MTKRLISLLFNNRKIIRSLYIIIKIFELINHVEGEKLPLDNFNVPCGYFDTVDLRNSTQISNGSYLFRDLVIPSSYVGKYDYELISASRRKSVAPHLRGCTTKLTNKPFIRWCCEYDELFDPDATTKCVPMNDTYTNDGIISKGGQNIAVDIYNYFLPQHSFRPCDGMYVLYRDDPEDEYVLFENGSIMLMFNERILDKNEICFGYVYNEVQNATDTFYATVFLCEVMAHNSPRIIFNALAMIFSIPFMLITIMVYTFIPELRNLHGKSLSCYLIGLVVGYSLMCSQIFYKKFGFISCHIIGFVTYFSFMSAFFWLSVISFDLWWNFRGTRGRNLRDSKRFYIFSLYAWGLAAICTGITVFAQLTDYIPEKYKPGIGGGDYCWLDVIENYSALAYFYGPVLAIITFNIIMFVITSLKIHHVQREVAKMIAREDSRKNLRTEKDHFGLFLRLFIVMGVTWSMEILSFLIGEKHIFVWVFYAIDVCNAVQGFLIFSLFVLKKKVKHLIFKRFKQARGINRSSQYSTKTTSSNMTLTTLNHTMTDKPLMDRKSIKE